MGPGTPSAGPGRGTSPRVTVPAGSGAAAAAGAALGAAAAGSSVPPLTPSVAFASEKWVLFTSPQSSK